MAISTTVTAIQTHFGITTTPGFFKLNLSRALGQTTNHVSWTWPIGVRETIGSGVALFKLSLQWSKVSSIRPNVSVCYFVSANQAPAADANWTNAKTWSNVEFAADTGANGANTASPQYSHLGQITSEPMAYRLIMNFTRNDPVAPPYSEMCWNVPLVVPSQQFTARSLSDPRGAQPRLEWVLPDSSWWP